jgi:hypothetical protein
MSGYNAPREYIFVIELGAGPFYSPKMGAKLSNGYVEVAYYDAPPIPSDGSANLVTPSAGELVFEVTSSDINDDPNTPYGTIPNGTVDATDLAYPRPSWAGSSQWVRITESVGVVGATHALVKVLRT